MASGLARCGADLALLDMKPKEEIDQAVGDIFEATGIKKAGLPNCTIVFPSAARHASWPAARRTRMPDVATGQALPCWGTGGRLLLSLH
jgi:hypothetical protein